MKSLGSLYNFHQVFITTKMKSAGYCYGSSIGIGRCCCRMFGTATRIKVLLLRYTHSFQIFEVFITFRSSIYQLLQYSLANISKGNILERVYSAECVLRFKQLHNRKTRSSDKSLSTFGYQKLWNDGKALRQRNQLGEKDIDELDRF